METATKVTLEKILDMMGIFYTDIEVIRFEDNIVKFNIKTEEDAPGLIGTHGKTLGALQAVVNAIMYSKDHYDEKIHIVVDVENYKERQEEKMFTSIDEKVERVLKFKKPIHLQPMNSYKRKIIHNHFKDPKYSAIVCESQGEDRKRHIVLRPRTELDSSLDLNNDEIF